MTDNKHVREEVGGIGHILAEYTTKLRRRGKLITVKFNVFFWPVILFSFVPCHSPAVENTTSLKNYTATTAAPEILFKTSSTRTVPVPPRTCKQVKGSENVALWLHVHISSMYGQRYTSSPREWCNSTGTTKHRLEGRFRLDTGVYNRRVNMNWRDTDRWDLLACLKYRIFRHLWLNIDHVFGHWSSWRVWIGAL